MARRFSTTREKIITYVLGFLAGVGLAAGIVLALVGLPQPASAMFASAALIVSVMYTILVSRELEQMKHTHRASIRPIIVLTRWSRTGELGVFAGEEGTNRCVYLKNVGKGLAHDVCARLIPPAEAPRVRDGGGQDKERPIHAVTNLEMPEEGKRLVDENASLCNPKNWRYMYAEYEDIEGNVYYTIQSGYSVKIEGLPARTVPETSEFWHDKALEITEWGSHLSRQLVAWAQHAASSEVRRADSG